MLKGINHNSFCTHFSEEDKEDIVEEKLEWMSDNDDVLDNKDTVQKCRSEECYSNNETDDILGNEDSNSDANKKAILEEKFESSSQDNMVEECYWNEEDICEIQMLGLHQFKEVLFLCESVKTGLAYHLNSSRIELLGDIYPTNYHCSSGYGYDRDEMDRVKYAFPYTPCWIEEFPRNS
jgi:hypothetical protein